MRDGRVELDDRTDTWRLRWGRAAGPAFLRGRVGSTERPPGTTGVGRAGIGGSGPGWAVPMCPRGASHVIASVGDRAPGTAPNRGVVVVAHVARSKTTVPGPPPELIRRPDLLAALDRGEDSALTLVCAPPGYGKTSLLSDWVRRQDIASAWVALEEEDDDAHRLWSAVLSALVTCPAVPPGSRLSSLVVPRTSVGADFLTDLCEALGDVPEPL